MTGRANRPSSERPVARPVDSSANVEPSLVVGRAELDSANDIVDAAPWQAAIDPASALWQRGHRVNQLVDSLANLDWQVITDVARFRLMSGQHLQRRFFDTTPAGGRAARRLLLRLVEVDVLARLERRIGGVRGGSAGFIYTLGLNGQKLLNQGQRARRHREPGWPFLNHTLAITELYVQICEEARSGTELTLMSFDPEPLCWRSQPGPGTERLHLRPDAYVIVHRRQRRQYWFVEIDLGTESRPTIKRKMQQYVRWLETGYEQARLDGVFPRVLWHTADEQRRNVLQELIKKTSTIAGLHVTDGLLSPPSIEEPP